MSSGRSGTGAARYRRNRAAMLAVDDLCRLCWHRGARTADHKVNARLWPRDATGRHLPGFDDRTNLQPAHGTMGGRQPDNPCPTCGKLCNQVKGARTVTPRRQSRVW